MKKLTRKISPRTSIESLIIFGIGIVTLALWMLPAFADNGTPYDPIVCVIWTIVLICLLTLNYIRALKAEAHERTVYLDRTNRKLYNEKVGVLPYSSPCQLTEIMASIFANGHSTDHREKPKPDSFELSAIIRTTYFDAHPHKHKSSPIADDSTIFEWSGVIEVPEFGKKFEFESLGDLEDMLCPLIKVDAISMVGQCQDAHTDSCLLNERIFRSSHTSNN